MPENHTWLLLMAVASCTAANSPCDRLAAGPTLRAVESTVCVGPPARDDVSLGDTRTSGSMKTDGMCGPTLVGRLVDTDGNGSLDAADNTLVVYGSGTDTVAQNPFENEPLWREYGGSDCVGLALADLDADGWPEVVVSTASDVAALSGQTGERAPFPVESAAVRGRARRERGLAR